MIIETYSGKYDKEIISLILSIQNNEAKIGLFLQEQPDLLDIQRSYQQPGVAHASHVFYEKAGFRKISMSELPVAYTYPDRNSILYMLTL